MARRRRSPYAMGRRRPPYRQPGRELGRDPMGGPDPVMGGPDRVPGVTTATVRGQTIRLTPAQRAAWSRQMAARARTTGMGASGVRTGHSGIPGASATPTAPAGATAPPGGGKGATPDPYAGMDPQVAAALRQIDWEQRRHQEYLGFGPSGNPLLGPDGQQSGVMGWLAGATKALSGISDAAGRNYGEQVTRGVGGAAATAAGAQTPSVAGRSTGGTYSPTEYESEGQRNLAASRGAAAQDMAAWQGMLETRLNVVRNQASLDAMADYAAGLPTMYATRRMNTRMEMEKYLADLEVRKAQAEETARSNRVREAQGAQNAMTNAAIAFGKLGISADKLAIDEKGQQVPVYDNVPTGFVQLPNGKIARDPTFSASGGAGGAAKPQSTLLEEKLRKEGWTKLGPGRDIKKIDRTKFKVVKASDTGAVMVIRRTGAGSGRAAKPGEVKPVAELGNDLKKLYEGSSDPLAAGAIEGIEDRYPGNPGGAAAEVADWVYSTRKQFTRPDGFIDVSRMNQVLKMALSDPNMTSSVMDAVVKMLAEKMSGKAPNRKWR